jgi:hypothetical protein
VLSTRTDRILLKIPRLEQAAEKRSLN